MEGGRGRGRGRVEGERGKGMFFYSFQYVHSFPYLSTSMTKLYYVLLAFLRMNIYVLSGIPLLFFLTYGGVSIGRIFISEENTEIMNYTAKVNQNYICH